MSAAGLGPTGNEASKSCSNLQIRPHSHTGEPRGEGRPRAWGLPGLGTAQPGAAHAAGLTANGNGPSTPAKHHGAFKKHKIIGKKIKMFTNSGVLLHQGHLLWTSATEPPAKEILKLIQPSGPVHPRVLRELRAKSLTMKLRNLHCYQLQGHTRRAH